MKTYSVILLLIHHPKKTPTDSPKKESFSFLFGEKKQSAFTDVFSEFNELEVSEKKEKRRSK